MAFNHKAWYQSSDDEEEVIYAPLSVQMASQSIPQTEIKELGIEHLNAPLDEEDLENPNDVSESKFEEDVGIRLLALDPQYLSNNPSTLSIFDDFVSMTDQFLENFDFENSGFGEDDEEVSDDGESHATVSGVTYHMKDHDPISDAIGQANEAAMQILKHLHTNEKSLAQSKGMTEQISNLKKMASESYKGVSSFPDDLGILKTPIPEDSVEMFKYFENLSPCQERELVLYRSHQPSKMPIDYYDNYEVEKDLLGNDLLYIIAMDVKTKETFDVGRCGSEAKLPNLKFATSDDVIKTFCYLYEQGDVPTTGLGFSNCLHFLTAVHLIQNVKDFTIEENRVDLVCEGTPIEISTRFEKKMSPNRAYLDKYSLCNLGLSPRFNKLMAASYASDRGVSDYLLKNRRNKYTGEYKAKYVEFGEAIQKVVETHKRLNGKQRKCLSEMEYACQLEDIINNDFKEEDFAESKRSCIQSIDECIDYNFKPRGDMNQWGCSTPFRMLRSGTEEFTTEPMDPNFVNNVLNSLDSLDPTRKSNYWLEKHEIYQTMMDACAIDGDTEMWGWRDASSPSSDRVQNVLDSLMCSKVYSSSQKLASVSLHLHRNNKRQRSQVLIMQKSCLVVWHSTHKFTGNQELFTLNIIRKVKDFYKGDQEKLDRMEGKWKRVLLNNCRYEVSPMFKIGSDEMEDLYSSPRKMAALYAAVMDKKERSTMEHIVKLMNLFFVSTVGGTWKTTTIVGKHRYITERIMSGYIDPVLISKDVCSKTKNFKKFADYAYLHLLRKCMVDWEHPHTYVAMTPLYRFTTDLMGLEMNLHYMMQSSLAAGSRHDETALEKMMIEICDFKDRALHLEKWYEKQNDFLLSLGEKEAFQSRLSRYRELRKPAEGTGGKNSLNLLMFAACSNTANLDIRKNQPGNVSGKAILSSLCTTKAALHSREHNNGYSVRNIFSKSKSVILVNEAVKEHWCPCLPILLLEGVHKSEDLIYYYFNKGAQKGEREISVMNLFMRFVQVMAESGMIRLSETMHGDTMYDPKKRDTFYRQTRKKEGYKKPATSSEDRSRFGPNQQPDEMAAALSILARDIGDSTVLNSAMCAKLFSDKIGVLPYTVDTSNVHTHSMKPIIDRVSSEIGFHKNDTWLVGKKSAVATTIPVKVSMGQGLLGTSAGVIHNTPLIAHKIFMKRAFNVTIEHTISSDDVSRTCHVPQYISDFESLGFLKGTFKCYENMLCATGTMDSSDKRIITENFGEYNNITVMANPLMNPDASVTEQMCVVNKLPHMYLLLDVMHARSSAKSVYLNGGTLTQVSVTMRVYNCMISQKWATSEDFHSLLGSHTGSCVSKLLSEDPGDIVSPLECVLGEEIMRNLYSRRKRTEEKEEDSLNVLLTVGIPGKKRGRELPEKPHFLDSDPMHSFVRSTKGSLRGLRLETKKQVIFKMKKTKEYRIEVDKGRFSNLSAFSALECLMKYPLTSESLSSEYVNYLRGNSVRFYSTSLEKRPPFRTFTSLKTPVPNKELRKVDLVWSTKMSNFRPPNASKETISYLYGLNNEQKLSVLENYERLKSMELVVHHNCGEPKQGFKYSLTSDLGFSPSCSFSHLKEEKKMTITCQVWGGESLQAIEDDSDFRDKLTEFSIRLCQINDRGVYVYKSKKSRFEISTGMDFVRISSILKLYRAVDDTGIVVYKLEEPDWSDIDPSIFNQEIPTGVKNSGLSSSTVQSYNYDNYSRCSNRTSLGISKHLGIDIKEWTVSGTYMAHNDQIVYSVSKRHFLTHLPSDFTCTGLIRVVREDSSNDDILCLNSDFTRREVHSCPKCSRAFKNRKLKT